MMALSFGGLFMLGNEKKRIAYLEGLRGVAALAVVFAHFLFGFYPALKTGDLSQVHTQSGIEIKIASSPLNLLYPGHFAVCLFFVLSGFVLSYGYFKKRDFDVIISSAIRRYFRFVVPIFFSTLLAYIMMKCSLFYNQQVTQITCSDWWLGRLFNMQPDFLEAIKQSFYYVLFSKAHSRSFYNGVLWTIPYEFLGSMLVLGMIALFGRSKNRYIIYLISAQILIDTYFFAFILGIILADLYTEGYLEKWGASWLNACIFLMSLFFASFPPSIVKGSIYEIITLPFLSNSGRFFHDIGSFLLLMVLLNSPFLQKVFSARFPQFLGRISFSMYLIHLLILGSLGCYLFPLLLGYVGYAGAFCMILFINLIVIFFLSHLMYKYIDEPAVRMSRWIYDYFFFKEKFSVN